MANLWQIRTCILSIGEFQLPVFILELVCSITSVSLFPSSHTQYTRLRIYRLLVPDLQGVSSGVAKVANSGRLLSARSTFTDLCHGLIVVANNRR